MSPHVGTAEVAGERHKQHLKNGQRKKIMTTKIGIILKIIYPPLPDTHGVPLLTPGLVHRLETPNGGIS